MTSLLALIQNTERDVARAQASFETSSDIRMGRASNGRKQRAQSRRRDRSRHHSYLNADTLNNC